VSDVSVWCADLDVPAPLVERLGRVLSEPEAARAERYRSAEAKRRFVVGRGIVRRILAAEVGVAPERIGLAEGPHGKPELAGSAAGTVPVDFSVSRRDDRLLVAVSRGARVGVDLELLRDDIDIDRIATRFFSRCEQRQLAALAPEVRLRAGFDCWTRKEAYLKGLGVGLTFGLDRFSVSVGPDGPITLAGSFPSPEGLRRWSLAPLDVGADAVGALAVEGTGGPDTEAPRPVWLREPYDLP
jgi:4'-phosphopantetheinyl transferase